MTAMKHIVPLVLIVCLLLGACSGPADPTESSADNTTPPSTDTTTQPTAEPTTAPTTEPTTEPSTAPDEVLYRNPLTGEPLDTLWTGRATAVVINNAPSALPHRGISGADIIYEIEAEGGVTRCLAIFSELNGIGDIGPVRSARTYFSNVAVSYDAPLIHCGGSVYADNAQYDDSGDKISNWEHINEQYNSSYFFRDQGRLNSGKAWEHTLFTSSENLEAVLAKKGYNTVNENGTEYGFEFADEISMDGTAAKTVKVTFRGTKSTTMNFNAETGLYEGYQRKGDWMDENTGEVVSFRNVIVLCVEQWFYGEYTFYDLIGSGEGYFACDGEIVPIKWSRDSLRDPFSYTLEDGTPLSLGVGTTYVGVTSARTPVEY